MELLPAIIGASGSVLSSVAGASGGQQMGSFGQDRVEGAITEAQNATRGAVGMAEDRMYDPIPYPQWDVSGMLGTTNIPGLSIPLGLNPEIQGVLDQNPLAQYTPQRPQTPQAVPKGGEGMVTPSGYVGGAQGGPQGQVAASPDDSRQALTDISMLIQELMKAQSGGGISRPGRQTLERSV